MGITKSIGEHRAAKGRGASKEGPHEREGKEQKRDEEAAGDRRVKGPQGEGDKAEAGRDTPWEAPEKDLQGRRKSS